MLAHSKNARWWFLAALVSFYFTGANLQKTVGDWCLLSNEEYGVCTALPECDTAIQLAHIGHRPIICSFRGTIPIVCCGEALKYELFHATSTTPKNIIDHSEKRTDTRRTVLSNSHRNSTRYDAGSTYYSGSHEEKNKNQDDFRKPIPELWSQLERQPVFDLLPTSQQNDERYNPKRTKQSIGTSSPKYVDEYPETTKSRPKGVYDDHSLMVPFYQKVSRPFEITKPHKPTYSQNNKHPNSYRPVNSNGGQSYNSNNNPSEYKPIEESRPSYPHVSSYDEQSRYPQYETKLTTRRFHHNTAAPPVWNSQENHYGTDKPYNEQRPTWPKEPFETSRPQRNRTTSTEYFPYQYEKVTTERERPPYYTQRTTRRQSHTTERNPGSYEETFGRPVWQQQTNSNTRKRISEIKCREYSKQVTDTIEALPLLPDPDPVQIRLDKCDINAEQLIVGGEKTTLGEFPHMAVLGYQDDHQSVAWNCGGTLISEYFVLTAAHCTSSSLGPPVLVRLGELNLRSNEDGAKPVDYTISNIIRHPEYRRPAKYNDIALIKLSRKVRFSRTIRPACLYNRDHLSTQKAIATGWGRIDFGESPSDDLLKVVLSIIDENTCQRLYRSDMTSLPRGIASSMICAGELNGGKDTCQGDSGGPLQITSKGNQCVYQIVGITSFGKLCAAKNAPGVYTKIASFVPWIEEVVWLGNS